MDFKKFEYKDVDAVVTNIDGMIKDARNTIEECRETVNSIGKNEDVWTGEYASRTAAEFEKSNNEFESFVSEFKTLINKKYDEANEAHHNFENAA